MDHDWLEDGDDEGFADGELPDDNAMETAISAEGEDELMEGARATTYFCGDPTTLLDGEDYGTDRVEKLMKSEPYQRKINTCHVCGQCWFDGQITVGCLECGGFPMKRPCLLCQGKCGAIWQRNIKLTHSFHEAHWEGQCILTSGVPPAPGPASPLEGLQPPIGGVQPLIHPGASMSSQPGLGAIQAPVITGIEPQTVCTIQRSPVSDLHQGVGIIPSVGGLIQPQTHVSVGPLQPHPGVPVAQPQPHVAIIPQQPQLGVPLIHSAHIGLMSAPVCTLQPPDIVVQPALCINQPPPVVHVVHSPPLNVMTDSNEDTLTEGMQDLSTS